jgi:16S rRNA A1518/A1519 N6-dimethyltransferase RsmA/KsgA/DIM1 with predicted DNA glycosylase/AP lyase activity
MIVKGKSFVPPPKVNAAVIQLIPRKQPLVDVEMEYLEKFCNMLFNQRRKTIENSIT